MAGNPPHSRAKQKTTKRNENGFIKVGSTAKLRNLVIGAYHGALLVFASLSSS